MNKDEELYAELFKETGGIKNISTSDSLALRASAFLTTYQMKKIFMVRSVITIAVRLSIIASVWLFLFRQDLWYGILLFSVLSLIFGGVADRGFQPRGKGK